MKQETAKNQIIELWCDREINNRKRADVLAFYFHLEKKHPALLKFKYRGGDKYQKIMGWLSRYVVE